MSDQKQNSNQYSAADIQRYLRGAMSAEEMHAMETAALDDPFLADAIEGFEMAMKEEDEKVIESDLEKLNKEFNERIKKPASVIPLTRFGWWQIAAAVIIFSIVGVAIYNNRSTPDENTRPKLAVSEKQKNDSISSQRPEQERSTTPSVIPDSQQNQDKKSITPSRPTQETAEATSPFSVKSKSRQDGELSKEKATDLALKETEAKDDLKQQRVELSAKKTQHLPTDAPISSRQRDYETPAAKAPGSGDVRSSQPAGQLNNFSGRVLDPNNKPLPYANLQIMPDRVSIVTDEGGNFNFSRKDSVVDVQVALIGFEQRNFRLQNNIGSNKLVLEPNNQNLQDVEVSSYGNERKKAASRITGKVQNAVPEIGWIEYEKYLEANKKVPATNPQLKGEVVVSFQVKRPNTLSDFEIEKSLSKDHDKEAIRLIQEGPPWKLLNSKKTRITVIVKF
ncbi:MAG TPA: carboxypeptidase-like regulatory domain-containing protein [Flavitalea sp.]|nr:carboxypeptidase-like regulatory domain-containing protein [Flavitalea sp.]